HHAEDQRGDLRRDRDRPRQSFQLGGLLVVVERPDVALLEHCGRQLAGHDGELGAERYVLGDEPRHQSRSALMPLSSPLPPRGAVRLITSRTCTRTVRNSSTPARSRPMASNFTYSRSRSIHLSRMRPETRIFTPACSGALCSNSQRKNTPRTL